MSIARWTDEEYQAHLARRAAPTAPAPKPMGRDPFIERLVSAGLPLPVREYVFLVDRKFAGDYVWIQQRVVCEMHGFRDHSTRKGLHRDWEKSNLAQLAGWKFLQFSPAQLLTEQCLWILRQVLA